MATTAHPNKGPADAGHGSLIGRLAKKATAKANAKVYEDSKTQVLERNGWLVRVNKAGKVIKRLSRIKKKRSFEKLKLLK